MTLSSTYSERQKGEKDMQSFSGKSKFPVNYTNGILNKKIRNLSVLALSGSFDQFQGPTFEYVSYSRSFQLLLYKIASDATLSKSKPQGINST